MPLANIPANEQEVIDQLRADVKESLPESNPYLINSFIDALIVGTGGRVFDFYRNLTELERQLFIDTATGEFLERLASFRGVVRNPAAAADGNIVFQGTATSIIPISTTLQSTDSQSYITTSETTIAVNVVSLTSLTRVGTVATATTAAAHNLATSVPVAISGAVQTEYNGTFAVTVISATTFTYNVAGSPATPATGIIVGTFTTALAPVISVNEGSDTNQASGAGLTLGSPIVGVNNIALVDFDGLTGGTDEENDTDFRARAIDRWQNPVALFNPAAITTQARLVPGVTRVFIREITPDIGQVTIFFTRDNDPGGPIPSAGEVNDVKTSILLIKPAHTDSADVIVQAPVAVTVNFIIDGISPNTTTMQDSITANLTQLFSESTDVGVALKKNDYVSAVNRTVDTVTGEILDDFIINNPIGDIIVATNELAILGTVSFT